MPHVSVSLIYNSRNYWSLLARKPDFKKILEESTIVEIIEAY